MLWLALKVKHRIKTKIGCELNVFNYSNAFNQVIKENIDKIEKKTN